MCVIVHPCFPRDPVGDTAFGAVEVPTILSEEYKRLIKEILIDPALLTVRTEVWVRSNGSLFLGHGLAHMVQEFDCLAKLD